MLSFVFSSISSCRVNGVILDRISTVTEGCNDLLYIFEEGGDEGKGTPFCNSGRIMSAL